MNVSVIPVLGDNYAYLVSAARGGAAFCVDPGEAAPVLHALRDAGSALEAVLLTHGHGDHTAGSRALRSETGCAVIGSSRVSDVDRPVSGADRVTVAGISVHVLATPGHTPDHLCFHAPGESAVWTGDTLFAGGCGRVAGGDYAAMWESLLRLRALPGETRVYCGHDYTVESLEFAAHLEPDNPAVRERLEAVRKLAARDRPTVPSRLADEQRTNPFLRADTDALRRAAGLHDNATPVEVFTALRQRKDRW